MQTHPKRMQGPPDKPLDTTPIEMPLGAMRPTPIQDIIARMVHNAIQSEKGDEYETQEEANDFEEEDETLLDLSPYTLTDIEDEAFIPPEPTEEPPELQPLSVEPIGDPPNPPVEEPEQP